MKNRAEITTRFCLVLQRRSTDSAEKNSVCLGVNRSLARCSLRFPRRCFRASAMIFFIQRSAVLPAWTGLSGAGRLQPGIVLFKVLEARTHLAGFGRLRRVFQIVPQLLGLPSRILPAVENAGHEQE